MKRFHFQLNISSARYLDYYRGVARAVIVRSQEGLTVQFPASLLQQYVTHQGVNGAFVLTCDDHNKLVGLEKVERIGSLIRIGCRMPDAGCQQILGGCGFRQR